MTDKTLPGVSLVEYGQKADLQGEEPLEVGRWYWVKQSTDKEAWFGCIVALGTNYVEVEGVEGGKTRIHIDEFDSVATLEPQPQKVIDSHIVAHRGEVNRLLGCIRDVTSKLAVTPSLELGSGETQALALRAEAQPDLKAYGKDLVLAKEKTLPELFKQVETANGNLATWLCAGTIPLKAQSRELNRSISIINDRIFSVELYAGLTETVVQIQEGAPATLTEQVYLFQRMCYMDEECLAQYRAGGMEFKDIDAFDRWLIEPENLNRLFPFPRCVVAFRVRRNDKEREAASLGELLRILEERQEDKYTFLYIRNGSQVFRLRTGIEFGPKLFPDLDRIQLSGKIWARTFGSHRILELISDADYQERTAKRNREEAEYEAKKTAYEEALKSPAAWARAKELGLEKPNNSCVDVSYPWFPIWSDHFEPYDKSSLAFDDITRKIQEQIKEHNRIALILQGLLDRSPVFHPHPPWQTWTPEGFEAAFKLVLDDSRALVAGEKPDFEAYRSRLNASLRVGSVTVGQDDAWQREEASRENARCERDWRRRTERRLTHFKPYGDPGPGMLARVSRFQPRTKKCSFDWVRDRRGFRSSGSVDATFTTDASNLLNVDAYVRGDFKQFFNDPRTRQEYLKWAPLLLEAEEYHAGNRHVADLKKPATKASSPEAKQRYARQKATKELVRTYLNAKVRLIRALETQSGRKYEVGTLWRVTSHYGGGKFTITRLGNDGSQTDDFVLGVDPTRTFERVDG